MYIRAFMQCSYQTHTAYIKSYGQPFVRDIVHMAQALCMGDTLHVSARHSYVLTCRVL